MDEIFLETREIINDMRSLNISSRTNRIVKFWGHLFSKLTLWKIDFSHTFREPIWQRFFIYFFSYSIYKGRTTLYTPLEHGSIFNPLKQDFFWILSQKTDDLNRFFYNLKNTWIVCSTI